MSLEEDPAGWYPGWSSDLERYTSDQDVHNSNPIPVSFQGGTFEELFMLTLESGVLWYRDKVFSY